MFGFGKNKEVLVYSPVNGKIVDVKKVKDEVFSNELMGKGIAVQPTDGKFMAPMDGNLITVFATGHAFGTESKNGIKVLIHVGLDTVELNGKGFNVHVKQDDKISKGAPLVDVDLEVLKKSKKQSITPIVVLNESINIEKKTITFLKKDGDTVVVGDPIISIK